MAPEGKASRMQRVLAGSTYGGDLSHLDDHPLVNPAMRKVRAAGMERHLLNIEAYGFSVVLPEEVDPGLRLRDRMLAAVLRLAEEATGVRHDVAKGVMGTIPVQGQHPFQYLLYSLMGKDPVFEEVVQHPKLLAVMEYFLGTNCQLNNVVSFIKRPDPKSAQRAAGSMGLHIDPHGGGSHGDKNALMTQPHYPHVFNAAWALTDYSKENGPIAVVPGSHRMQRRPMYEHGEQLRAERSAVPVEAPAGSLIFFHGNTWHGAFPKSAPGLRVNLTTYFCGAHFKPQESYRHLEPAVVARNPPRFAELVGWADPWGFEDNRGPVPWGKRGEVNGGRPFAGGRPAPKM